MSNVRLAALVAQLFMFVAYLGAVFVGLYAITLFGQDAIANPDNVMPPLTLELVPGAVAGVILAAALSADAARDRATETVHEWTRRRFALGSPANLSVERTVSTYKLLRLASRPDDDVLVDSVRGTETPYDE